MAETAGAVPLPVAHTTERSVPKPSWADVGVARRLHCKLPLQVCRGHQPLEVEKAGGLHPYDEQKCADCGCRNALVCKTDPKRKKIA